MPAPTSGDGLRRSPAIPEPDAHGQAALLLAESILHELLARGDGGPRPVRGRRITTFANNFRQLIQVRNDSGGQCYRDAIAGTRQLRELPPAIGRVAMSKQANRDYYRRRQRQEEAAAGAATDPAARLIHEELAARYEARAGAPAKFQRETLQAAVAG